MLNNLFLDTNFKKKLTLNILNTLLLCYVVYSIKTCYEKNVILINSGFRF